MVTNFSLNYPLFLNYTGRGSDQLLGQDMGVFEELCEIS